MQILVYYKRGNRTYEMEVSEDEYGEIEQYQEKVQHSKKEFAKYLKVLEKLQPSRVKVVSSKTDLSSFVEQ